jgi:hypothetical protein
MKATCLGCLGLLLWSGCSNPLVVNPFCDEYAHRAPVTTPSVDAVLAANVSPSIPDPIGVEKVRCAVDGSVLHTPLYFEDPFEECGSEDGHFMWTGEDYVWMVSSRARFMANLIAWPVSAVVTPPGTPMVSDGRLSCCGRGCRFDAEPCPKHDEAEGSEEPADLAQSNR